jgi:hypothetical protein
MRLNEFITEDKELAEGPLMNKIGSAVGKAVGTAAKGVGAVAGGIAGLGAAAKKGFAAGKSTVAGAGDDEEPAQGQAAGGQQAAGGAGGQQAAGGQGGITKRQVAQDMWKKGKIGQNNPFLNAAKKAGMQDTDQEEPAQGQAGGQQPAASGQPAPAKGKPAAGGAAQPDASGRIEPTMEPAQGQAAGGQGQDQAQQGTPYAQVKAKIAKLDKKGKQRILAGLQKELGAQPAAQEKPAAGGGAFGQMAANLAGEPNPAVSTGTSSTGGTTSKVGGTTTHTANPNNPNMQQQPAPEQPAATQEPAVEPTMQTKKRAPRKSRAKAPAQPSVQAAGKVNTGNPLAEALERKIEEHKKKLFTENVKSGATSIFKK